MRFYKNHDSLSQSIRVKIVMTAVMPSDGQNVSPKSLQITAHTKATKRPIMTLFIYSPFLEVSFYQSGGERRAFWTEAHARVMVKCLCGVNPTRYRSIEKVASKLIKRIVKLHEPLRVTIWR